MSMLWDLFGSQIISDDSGELWGLKHSLLQMEKKSLRSLMLRL